MKISLSFKLGILAGVINCAVWYIVGKSLNFYSLEVDQYRYYATLILLVIGIFASVFYERKNNGGFLEFKKGVKAGVLFALALAVLLGVFNYFYYTFIVPDAVEFFISEAKKMMLEQNISEADMAKSVEVIKSYFGSFRMAMSTMIIGVILSLLAGAVFRKKNPNVVPFSEN